MALGELLKRGLQDPRRVAGSSVGEFQAAQIGGRAQFESQRSAVAGGRKGISQMLFSNRRIRAGLEQQRGGETVDLGRDR